MIIDINSLNEHNKVKQFVVAHFGFSRFVYFVSRPNQIEVTFLSVYHGGDIKLPNEV